MEEIVSGLTGNEALKLITEKVETWFEQLVSMIPNFIIAVLVIISFVLISKVVRNLLERTLKRTRYNSVLTNLLVSMTGISIIIFGAFISLEILNLEKTVTSLLAGAGVIGLALGFAFQEIAANFVSGIFIAVRRPYQLGDILEINSVLGEVTAIQMRTTSLTTFDGLEVIIPNKQMFTSPFINYTTTPSRRVDLEVGVSYNADLERVKEITKNSLKNIPGRIKDRDIEIYFGKFDSSSINFTARVWIHYPGNQSFLKAKDAMIINIKKAFDKNGITIPFPIRTLEFEKTSVQESLDIAENVFS